MAVPTSITDLSTTASSNSPAGTEAVLPNLDNYLRAHAAFIAQLSADSLSKSTGGTVAAAVTFSAVVTLSNGATGALTGNASTASTLETARTIALTGGATGTATSFNGSANISIPVTALDATLLTGTIPAGSLGNASQFTTSTSAGLTDYPVGSVVMVYTAGAGSIPDRNASATVYIDAGNSARFLFTASGSALTGTWRARGAVVSTGSEIDVLMQRVA